MTAAPELDRSLPPPRRPVPPYRFPAFVTRRLASGLRLILLPERRLPLIHLQLICSGGAEFEGPDEAGLVTLAGALLDEGTTASDALDIARRVEGLGGVLATYGDWEALHVSAGLLSRHTGWGLELVAEIATDATLPEHEVERLRQMRLTELRRRRWQPAALAARALASDLYAGTPYGHLLTGTEETVGAIERPGLAAFCRRHLTPRGAVLIAVGDLDPEPLTRRIDRAFGSWSGPEAPSPPPLEPPPRRELTVHVVDRPHGVQTELRIGHAAISRRHPDYVPFLVLSTLVGGKFTSRINLSLREGRGVTYGAWSRLSERRGPGPFVVGAAVATEAAGEAVDEILDQLRRLREEKVGEQELRDTRDYLTGVFPYSLQSLSGLAQRLEEMAIFSLPDDHFRTYSAAIEAVTAEDVLRVARAHLRPDRAAVVAVGPAAELRPRLERFGPLRETPGPRSGEVPRAPGA